MGPVETLCVRVVRQSVCVCVCVRPLSPTSSYSAPGRQAEYCDERVCLSVCVCLCLSTIISSELHIQSSSKFLCLLPMAVARSSAAGVVIRYVLPVFRYDVIFALKPRLLDVAAQQCTRSLGLGCIMCAVIPGAGQRAHRTSFRALPLYP